MNLATNKENSNSNLGNTAAILGADELRELRDKLGKTSDVSNAAIITKDELERIKKATVIETKEEKKQKKKIADEQLAQTMSNANARKSRMADADKTRASKMPPTQQDVHN